MKRIIAITGFNRCGKSTLAKNIVDIAKMQNTNAKIISFGESLRQDLEKLGFTRQQLDTKTPAMRRLLRSYGDAAREVNKSFFADRWAENAIAWAQKEHNNIIVVDDLYHLIEMNIINSLRNKFSIDYVLVTRKQISPTQEEIDNYDSVRETKVMQENFLLKKEVNYYHIKNDFELLLDYDYVSKNFILENILCPR